MDCLTSLYQSSSSIFFQGSLNNKSYRRAKHGSRLEEWPPQDSHEVEVGHFTRTNSKIQQQNRWNFGIPFAMEKGLSVHHREDITHNVTYMSPPLDLGRCLYSLNTPYIQPRLDTHLFVLDLHQPTSPKVKTRLIIF